MTTVVPINHTALAAVAVQALDLVERYGEALLVHVADPDAVRRYIRTEARRRNQRLRSHCSSNSPDQVFVVVENDDDLAPAARTWRAGAADRMRQAMSGYPRRHPGPPLPRPWLLDVAGRA